MSLKSSVELGSHRRRVAQHQCRHQRARLAAPVRHRVPQPLADPLRPAAAAPPAGWTRRGAERTRTIAARSDPRSGGSSRPETSTRLPTGSRDHGSSAAPVTTTSTGARKWLVSPRPATSTSVARAVPYAPRTACRRRRADRSGSSARPRRPPAPASSRPARAQPVRERTAETGEAGDQDGRRQPPRRAPEHRERRGHRHADAGDRPGSGRLPGAEPGRRPGRTGQRHHPQIPIAHTRTCGAIWA